MPFEGMDFGILSRGVPQVDVAGSMAKGMQLRDMMQARKDDEAMRELSAQAGGNLGQLADLAQQKGLYRQAQGIRKQQLDAQKEIVTIQETLGKVDKQRRDAIQAGNEDVGKMAAWADTPEKWTQGMQVVVQDHPIIAQGLQPFLQFSPENRKAVLTRAATVSEALKGLQPRVEEQSGAMVPVTTDITGQRSVGAPVGFKAQDPLAQLEQDVRNGLISPEDAFQRRKLLREGKPAVQVNMGEQKAFTNETTLRKEYNDEIKGFRTVKDAYKRIEVAGANDSAASDISLIYGYMKLLDPGSVVREGEFATAQNAAGIPERIQAAYNKALTGERLAAGTKQDFLKQSQLIYEQALAAQQGVASRYRGIAEKYGLDPASVITDEAAKPKSSAPESRWKAKAPSGTPDMTTLGKNPRAGEKGVWIGAGAPDGAGWYVREGKNLRRVE